MILINICSGGWFKILTVSVEFLLSIMGRKERMLESVIFDMDGVIIDTHRCAYQVLVECAARYGVNLTIDVIVEWGSLSGKQFWEKVKNDFELNESLDDLMAAYDYEKEMSYYEQIGLMPGVEDLIKMIDKAGIAIGLATSAEDIRIERVLELGDLSRFFSSVVSAGDVRNHKPDPECYILSCNNLNCNPKNCLVIEDSSNGAVAAKSAECRLAAFYGYMWQHDPFDADIHIRDFRNITSINQLMVQ